MFFLVQALAQTIVLSIILWVLHDRAYFAFRKPTFYRILVNSCFGVYSVLSYTWRTINPNRFMEPNEQSLIISKRKPMSTIPLQPPIMNGTVLRGLETHLESVTNEEKHVRENIDLINPDKVFHYYLFYQLSLIGM